MKWDHLSGLKNKTFAYACLRLFQNSGQVDDSALKALTDSSECHRLFRFSGGFSVLQEVPADSSDAVINAQCRDHTGRLRYYKDSIQLNSKHYVVSNHWYGPNKSMPDNRTPFLAWVKAKITS